MKTMPVRIVLGLIVMSLGWFGVSALMSNNVGSQMDEQLDPAVVDNEAFVKTIRANYPEATNNFSDDVLVNQAVDVCLRLSEGVPQKQIIDDFTITMAVTENGFSSEFVSMAAVAKCPEYKLLPLQ